MNPEGFKDWMEPIKAAPMEPTFIPSTPKPVTCDDLKRRLELLAKYGVRNYRDGVLSIDLDPSFVRKRDAAKDPDEQPEVPPL